LKYVWYREVAWCRRLKDLCRRLAKSDDTNNFWRHVDRAQFELNVVLLAEFRSCH